MNTARPVSRRALLVQGAGPRRSGLAAALAAAGWTVDTVDEPYAATAQFVAAPSDLVVFSLRRFRRQDTAFFGALRASRPDVRILALVPSRRREAAARALQAGADAQLPEPCYPEEFVAAVEALFRHGASTAAPDDGLQMLAGEVAHAINNPLQILSLIGEADGLPAARAQDVRAGVDRIRQVTRILVDFGNLDAPQPKPQDLRVLLDDALGEEGLHAAGTAQTGAPAPVLADARQVRVALRTMAGYLRSGAQDPRAPIEPAVEAADGHDPVARLSLQGAGRLDPVAHEQALHSVLWVRDDTREVFPGLRIAATVAALNGGELLADGADGTLRLGLRLPAGP